MKARRIGGNIVSGGDPYRGWMQSEDMKIHYELTREELTEAISEWIHQHHGHDPAGSKQVICTFDNTAGRNGESRTTKKGFFDQYQITLECDI